MPGANNIDAPSAVALIATGAEGAEFRARVMNGVMVACGSLYMAADVRRYFGRTE